MFIRLLLVVDFYGHPRNKKAVMRGSILPVTILPRTHPRENLARLALGWEISSSGLAQG